MGPLELERKGKVGISRFSYLEAGLGDGGAAQLASEFLHVLGDDCLFYNNDTMPVDDTCPLEDAFETQLVDPTAESQEIDFAVDTQVVDDVSDGKSTGGRNVGAGTNGIEAVSEAELLTQDKIPRRPCGKAVENGLISSQHSSKQVENIPRASSDLYQSKELHSGSACRGFTSIRVASTRACGLAARAKGNLWKSSLEPQKCLSESESSVDLNIHPSDCNRTYEKQKSSCKISSNTVRRLFGEDDLAEVGLSDIDMDSSDDNVVGMPEFMSSENCFTGLSYVDNHEPGDQSQAHALEVVDNFINLIAMEYEEDLRTNVHTTEKTNVISGAKGCLDLVQNFVGQSIDRGREIYEWDDAREKDGGGDFFVRKKDLLFNDETPNRSCFTEPRKPRCPGLGSIEGRTGDEKKRNGLKEKVGGSVYSDSKLLQHRQRSKKKSFCHKEDFTSIVHKDLCTSRTNPPETATNSDFLDMDNIGQDTQIAAEAMEILFDELHTSKTSCNGSKKRLNKSSDGTGEKGKRDRNARPKQSQIAKTSSIGIAPRKAKRIRSTNTEETVDHSPLTMPRKGNQPMPMMTKQKKLAGMNVSTLEKKHHLEEKLPDSCSGDREGKYDFVSARVVRKRTVKNHKNAEMDPSEEAGEPVSCKSKQSKQGPEIVDAVVSEPRCSRRLKRSSNILATSHERTAEGANTIGCIEHSLKKRCRTSLAACATPDDCVKKLNNASPLCMGDEYPERSCKQTSSRLSLTREINRLLSLSPQSSCEMTGLRKRRDIAEISVLFSQHLDTDVVKHQEKILARLGSRTASSMSDASHFVAAEFMRTRNMLEAIASGKPVVTPSWLESCGQASCLIDEKKYILRDAKKEKEFGFCLPVSLARAFRHPLLQGVKVLITPNAKPSKAIVSNLVRAVGGSPVERLGRSVVKDGKVCDDLLILTSEEDYEACVPLLEKGGAAYSTELLLNGIVVQKLEYERHRVFEDHLKRTRSTIWVKKKGQCSPAPVNKTK